MATEVHAHRLGEPYKRKEDARFIRGQGQYVDDVQLSGMLYGDIVRSPYAHALIKNVDISAALKVPGVLAVITGKDLDAAGLAWMPTLSADTEAVLALDRVHFQMQEVAFVVATSRYAAADGVDAVEVEYEPLRVVVDPKKALDPDAPLLPLPRPKPTGSLSCRKCLYRVSIRHRLRPVAVWPTSRKRRASSTSGSRHRRRTPIARSLPS